MINVVSQIGIALQGVLSHALVDIWDMATWHIPRIKNMNAISCFIKEKIFCEVLYFLDYLKSRLPL